MSSRRWAAIIAVLTIALVTLIWRAGWWRPAPIRATHASYVDSKQCQACHATIHRDYQHVGMARSFAPAAQAAPIEDYENKNHFAHALSGRHYQMLRRGGRVYQRRYEVDPRGAEVNVYEQEATFVIGSGLMLMNVPSLC